MLDNKKDYIEIGVAVIRRGNQVLLGKRPQNKVFGGKWEFLGGKIEPGELPEECVAREISEELGMVLKNIKPLTKLDYQYSDGKKFTFHVYSCEISEGEPQALWHDEIMWVDKDKLVDVEDLLAADLGLIPLVQEKIV